MFKFLRKILVLGLVFSLSIPSFAAVSVSDGSAFVSKAEFSASLNNLSSRMSNLENSLDAKIDSLVSSYLSRNGIWNGEAVTIDNGNKYNINNPGRITSKVLPKSGLMVLPYKIRVFATIGVYHKKYNGKLGRPTGAYDDTSETRNYAMSLGSPVEYSFVPTFLIKSGTFSTTAETKATVINYYSLTGEYDTTNSDSYRAKLNVEPGGNLIFFVSKNDYLYLNFSASTKVSMNWWGMTYNSSSLNTSLSSAYEDVKNNIAMTRHTSDGNEDDTTFCYWIDRVSSSDTAGTSPSSFNYSWYISSPVNIY